MPLMLTYIYGVVVLSLCRSRSGCGGSRSPPGDLSLVELENLTKHESCAAVRLLACALHWAAGALVLPRSSVAVTSPEPGTPCGPLLVLPQAVPRTPLSLWGGCRLVYWGRRVLSKAVWDQLVLTPCQEPGGPFCSPL